MAKPRNSVLYMFDPLQSPSTPRRDSSSSELSASDKENDGPCGDVTMFFNRICAAQQRHDVQVFTPKGKLIDIGDTPAPLGTAWDGMEHDGSDADGEQSESDAEGCSIPSPPRRPFAELDVDHTPRPSGSSRPAKGSIFGMTSSPSQDSTPLPAMLVPAPQTSPLADVVNSINFSSMSLAGEPITIDRRTGVHSQTQEAGDSKNGRASSPFPEINVCAPETPSTEDYDISGNHDNKPAMMSASHLRPTSSLTQLSPDDPRRTSVDLYSSFHLQMQSAEMSFDLLNDKISFFGHGQDSFWSAGDDALEFDETGLPPALKAKVDKLVNFTQPPAEHTEPVFSPPAKAVRTPRTPHNTSLTIETAMNVPLPLSPSWEGAPSRDITPPRLSQPALDEQPSPPTSPVVADEPSLMLESEPLPPPVSQPAQPSVPALRIMKKTFRMAKHQSVAAAPTKATPTMSTQHVEKPESVVLAKRRPSLSVAPKIAPAPAPAPPRPVIRGVQRPPASMTAGGVVIGLPPQGSSSNTSGSTSSSGSGSTRATSAALAPAPASRFAGIQRPNFAAKERAAPRSVSGAARPAAPATGITRATSMVAPKAPVSSALRPPARIAAPGPSALPKPASRLPGPSGIARTASASSIGAGAGTAASRARASTLSRATGRF
ncbi:hypothetical protein BD309DRAFT_1008463 [Dichomitus squalens]|uniref:Uncharacterized protein n=1 Tax=Dichomitus squalens TaxID=114155 RepID=A0A4Q9NY89_9APHY|nr:hypothetical protein BD309DRAFT_1008463 [Dichomitus squalens]TBU62752.1 hypothetical protein BD310DRAFT_870908 [Dichomitus squalens]